MIEGEAVWGIGSMILAIPLTGIVKLICNHVGPLQPYGFLIGQEKKKLADKLKRRRRKITAQ